MPECESPNQRDNDVSLASLYGPKGFPLCGFQSSEFVRQGR